MVQAGAKVRAADIPTGTWLDYTPTWSSSGTAPVLGNGSLTSRYCQIGDLVIYQGRLVAGSTTTYGTGTYGLSLPVTAYNAFGSNGVIGSIWWRDGSGADFQGQAINVGTAFNARPAGATYGGNSAWGATAPMTMANGDWVSWTCTYEAA
jgi:transcription elongation factor